MAATRKKKTSPPPEEAQKPRSEKEIQKIITELVRKFGPQLRHWEHFTHVVRESGLQPGDFTDERLYAAEQTIEESDEKMRAGFRTANAEGRITIIFRGDPEFDPAVRLGNAKPTASPDSKEAKSTQQQEPARPRQRSKMRALEAAEKVLREEGKPMSAKEIVDLMASRGYWESSRGKTPDATIAASIYVDIKTKGVDSPFMKVGKNLFSLR